MLILSHTFDLPFFPFEMRFVLAFWETLLSLLLLHELLYIPRPIILL